MECFCNWVQVYTGCDVVKENKQAFQSELWFTIEEDPYLKYAVEEAHERLRAVLLNLLNEDGCDWYASYTYLKLFTFQGYPLN